MSRLWFSVLFLAAAGGLIAAEPPKEPTHDGKTIAEWVKQLDTDDAEVRAKVYEAMRAFAGRPEELAEAVFAAACDPKTAGPDHAHVLRVLGPKAVPVLTNGLWSSDERTRRVAAFLLNQIGEDARSAAPALVRLLADKNADERNAAAQALAGIGAESAIPQLKKLLADADGSARKSAVNALGLLGADAADLLPVLVELLESPIRDMPEAAARTIGDFGPEAAPIVPKLLPYFTLDAIKKSPSTVQALVESVGRIGPGAKDAVPALKKLFRDLDKEAAPYLYPVAVSLWKIARDPEAAKMLRASIGEWHADWTRNAEVLWRIDRGPETVKVLEDLLKSDKPEPVIGAAGILGAKSKTAVPLLAKMAAHKDANVRARAVVALVKLGPDAKPAAEALAAAAKDDDPRIAFWATAGVARLDPKPDTVAAVAGYLSDRDSEQRLAAADTLARLGSAGKPAVARLITAQADSDGHVRITASVALWRIERNPSALPVAVEQLRHRDPVVRSQAAVDLGAHFGSDARSAVPDLVKRLYDPFSRVRSSAAESLGRIGPNASAAVRPLLALIDGDEPAYVQSAACEALGLIGVPETEIEAANALLKKRLDHPDPLTRVHAALALARLNPDKPDGKAGEKVAEGLLGCRTHYGRITAAEALWLIKKDERVVPLLVRTLEESNLDGTGNDNDRYMAARALGRIGPPAKAAVAQLQKLLTHHDPLMVVTVVAAIKAIEPEPKKDGGK